MKKTLYILVLVGLPFISQAQDEKIDASKPTNFYTQINNQLEYNSRKEGGDLLGYRLETQYSLSPANMFLFELPILHNTASNATGIGDLRLRYFWLPYKNYNKVFGAFGPSIDVFMPTGNADKGLGTGSWLIQPGITAGIMLSDWIQLFPVLSYQFTSVSNMNNIPDDAKSPDHGISFQIITPIVFSEKFFVQVTPIYSAVEITQVRKDRYIQEIFAQYAIKPKVRASVFWRGIFIDVDHTIRLGIEIFIV